MGVAEERESEAGGEMSSHVVEQIDLLISLVNLEIANPREAAIFWSKALSRLAQLVANRMRSLACGQPIVCLP